MDKLGWLVNDRLTCISGTKTFWHNLLDWFPNLIDKTNGYTKYAILPYVIEEHIQKSDKENIPHYIIRNGSYFRKLNTNIKTISLIQDVLINNETQIDVIQNSDIVVFNTNYVFNKYKKYINNPASVRICPLGVDFDFFKPSYEININVLPNSILFIGSTKTYPKGFNIVRDLIIKMTDCNFCLILKDDLSINNTLLPKHVLNRVKIFNQINQEEVKRIINSCICAICTSYEETQHLSGIECGACNLPIIAREVGIYFDCKDDTEWGVLANDTNFSEKIRYVLNNKDKFNPREYFYKKYSNEVCKENWLNIIKNI
jgi:glycosyltransferase involved in cell wall biosynthesis